MMMYAVLHRNRWILMVLACGILAINTAGIATAANGNSTSGPIVLNSDFEKPAQNGKVPDWISLDYGWDVESAGNSFIVTGDSHSGNGAGAIILNTYQTGWSASLLNGLKGDRWYCMTMWIKTDYKKLYGKGAVIFVLKHLPGGNRIGNSPDKYFGGYTMGRDSKGWELIKMPFKTPKDPEHLYLGIGLYEALGALMFDDIKVTAIDESEADKIKKEYISFNPGKALLKADNFIINGSFEITNSYPMPDAWNHSMHYSGQKRDYYNAIRVVKDKPYHGKKCFKFKNGEIRYLGGFVANMPKLEKKSVLSFYLRSNEPGSEFTVFDKKFTPSKEWKRFSVNRPVGKKADFWIRSKGTVFIDAVQMEYGDKPTDYKDHSCNSELAVSLPALPKYPTASLKGKVQDDKKIKWADGFKINNLKLRSGKKALKTSTAYIVKGKRALHVRVECRGREFSKLVKKITKRDTTPFSDDTVTVAINPGFKNGESKGFIFTVNALGVQLDAKGSNISWNSAWESKIDKLEDGYRVDLTIPYSTLNDPFATSEWQINLIRQSAAVKGDKREVSAWFYSKEVAPENSGVLVSGFKDLGKYRITVSNPEVNLCNIKRVSFLKSYAVGFEIGFPNKLSQRGTAVILAENGFKRQIKWYSKNGLASLEFSDLTEEEIMDLKKFRVQVFQGSKILADKHFNKRLMVSELLKVGPLDRSYYTSEKTAGLLVEVPILAKCADKLELDVEILGAAERVFNKRYPAVSGLLNMTLPKLSPGTYRVRVKLVPDNGESDIFARGEVALMKLNPAKMEAKVNRINRMLVINGKESISHAISLSVSARSLKSMNRRMKYLPKDIDAIAKRFTAINPLYVNLVKDTEKTVPMAKKIAEKLHQAGLDVAMALPHPGGMSFTDPKRDYLNEPIKELEKYKMKDWPVFAWTEFEETYVWWKKNPENREKDHLDMYWKMKKYDPYRLFNTDTAYCGRIYGGLEHADWIGGSYYPITLYPSNDLVVGVRGFVMETERARKTIDARIITGGFLPCFAYERGREPSAEEYNACFYIMLIHGCRAVNVWMYAIASESLWDGMIPLKEQLTFLSPIFSEGKDITSQIAGSNDHVDFTAYSYKNKVYLVTTNYSRQKLTASFDLNLLKRHNSAKDVFDKDVKVMKNGILTDVFVEYGVHVYEIK